MHGEVPVPKKALIVLRDSLVVSTNHMQSGVALMNKVKEAFEENSSCLNAAKEAIDEMLLRDAMLHGGK